MKKLHHLPLLTILFATSLLLQAQNKDSTDTAPGASPAPAPAAPAAPAPPVTDSGANLLSNGNFETPSAKDPNWPDIWGKGAGITWENENGKHFLRLVQQKPGAMLMAYREMAIPAETKGLEITIRYRVTGLALGTSNWFDARTIMHFLNSDRKQVTPDPGALVFSKNAPEWAEVTKRFVVPPDATVLQLMPALFQVAAGTLDLQEIKVTPLSDADAAAITNAAAAADKKKADEEAAIAKDLAMPPITPEIRVSGNKLVKADGSEAWLQGVNVCSLEWAAAGNNVLWSMKVALDTWKANCIRLPVNNEKWFGRAPDQKPGEEGANAYRMIVDNAIKLAASKGAYVVLDLHRFQAPDDSVVEFWKDAAARYKNNPAVLFDIFNEPCSITWDVWRNGGDVEKTDKDKNKTTYHSPGMQAVVDAVRSTGAKNIIIAGGLDWAYDDSGILKGYALTDKTGNGIMYSVHVYNWKTDWQHKFMDLAATYPLFLGECGADIHKMGFIPLDQQEDPYTWVPDLLGLIQKNHLNWTGWSFHTSATPDLLANWNYEPTPYWGAFAKDALGGKQFELHKMR
jgi:hypothetical protein